MTDFQRSYKIVLFNKILPCEDFLQHNGSSLNIFCTLQGSLFSFLFNYLRDILELQRY